MVGFVVDFYFGEIVASAARAKHQKIICVEYLSNSEMQHHTLPHRNLFIIFATPIGNAVHIKSLIHPMVEQKSHTSEQIK